MALKFIARDYLIVQLNKGIKKIDFLLEPPVPEFLLALNIRFQSATLLWNIPSEASPNDTYTVSFWNGSGIPVRDVNVQNSAGQFMLQATVFGLSPGTLYHWTVEVKNSISSAQSTSLQANFTTVDRGMLHTT